MRVIAGSCRGMKLSAPAGMTTRPTSDRVKESLFSILTSRLTFDGLHVLDICAGTGGLGIEALSRGAESCCFIESDHAVAAVLEKNLLQTRCRERSTVVRMDAVKGLTSLGQRHCRYDLVFFDPPYASSLYGVVLETLSAAPILADDVLVVAECSIRHPLAECYGRLKRVDRRPYGDTVIELFSAEE